MSQQPPAVVSPPAAVPAAAAVAPPSAAVLSLVSALSNTADHGQHVEAIAARDRALSAGQESYGGLCLQLAALLAGSDRADGMIAAMGPEWTAWKSSDAETAARLQADPACWIPFGQMSGLILKNALLRPPVSAAAGDGVTILSKEHAAAMKHTLLAAVRSRHEELRAVAGSVIAATAVSADSIQAHLHVGSWPELIPTLLGNLSIQQVGGDDANAAAAAAAAGCVVEGSLSALKKIMEDGPDELSQEELDHVIPAVLPFLSAEKPEKCKVLALQCLQAMLASNIMPAALVVHWQRYLSGLSALAVDAAVPVRKWVCRSIVTLTEKRTEYIAGQHFESVCQFMLQSTADRSAEPVALEATEFWLCFCHLDRDYDDDGENDGVDDPDGGGGAAIIGTGPGAAADAAMLDTVSKLLPHLVPVLLGNMVYTTSQREELQLQNRLELSDDPAAAAAGKNEALRPVFHKSRAAAKHAGGNAPAAVVSQEHDGYQEDSENGDDMDDDDDDDNDDDDDDDDDDEDGNEWTLRKCAAASLDSLANLYGAELILPCLLPSLERGLAAADVWVQEASILALGAVAEGCRRAMHVHLTTLHPYLLHVMSQPEDGVHLPQLKSIAAWCLGRYAQWAVEQVQTGAQGHLLAQMTEAFLGRLSDRHRRVQVACLSAFGAVLETAGDLMAPYLRHVYAGLAAALPVYRGKSLLLLLDVLGITADFCGPAIAEGELPAIYVPPLLAMWDGLARNDVRDKTLLPLMECLASMACTAGVNFQPYAVTAFDMACATMEQVTLILTTAAADGAGGSNRNSSGRGVYSRHQLPYEEDAADPIICAADLLDGLVEGLKGSFQAVVAGSSRYGPHFLAVLQQLCQHDVPGVRMSGLALTGDLVRHCPALLEPALQQLLSTCVENMDPVQPAVCTNAVWAVGEICLQCRNNPAPLESFAKDILQNLIALLQGNGVVMNDRGGDDDDDEYDGMMSDGGGINKRTSATSTWSTSRGADVPGLCENAAACVGRLAMAHAPFVAAELSRFLLGWCDGMSKISDPTERRDAFDGFVSAVYANPAAIQQAAAGGGGSSSPDQAVQEAFAAILFAVVTWHIPQSDMMMTGSSRSKGQQSTELLSGEQYRFLPFPAQEAELGQKLQKLLQDMKASVTAEQWHAVEKELPVNVRKLLRETYGL